MTTLPTTDNNKGSDPNKISRGELAYICNRNLHDAYSLLAQSIKESGLTQKQLSERTGVDEASISRLLRRPRNMELNTLSKLVYAASKAALSFTHSFPASRSNFIFQVKGSQEKMDTSNITALFTEAPTTQHMSSGYAGPIIPRGDIKVIGEGSSSEGSIDSETLESLYA